MLISPDQHQREETPNQSLVCHEVYIIQLVTMQKEEIQPDQFAIQSEDAQTV